MTEKDQQTIREHVDKILAEGPEVAASVASSLFFSLITDPKTNQAGEAGIVGLRMVLQRKLEMQKAKGGV